MSRIPRSLPAQGDTTANVLSVEAMFAQILTEISELRQECAELRHANTSLERQVKEGLNVRPLQVQL